MGKEPYPPEKKLPLDAVFAAVPVEDGYGGTVPIEGAMPLETLLLLSKDLCMENGCEIALDNINGKDPELEA